MISVIIPVINEERRLAALLAGLIDDPASAEVLVVDGGSDDRSSEVARASGARVLSAPRGRGQQLAAGAAAARGDVLVFLHADSELPAGALARIEVTLAERPDLVGGNFRIVFDGDDRFSAWLTHFYARFRRYGLYYGDSGIFVRRAVYDRIGGVRPIALMEDYDFTRRLERAGRTCCIVDPPITSSSRRFAERTPAGIVWGWLWIHALYHLGVSPEHLARRYDSERRRGSIA